MNKKKQTKQRRQREWEPTQAEIQEATACIRAGWSDGTRKQRRYSLRASEVGTVGSWKLPTIKLK
jgi:hypothetical protein